MKVGFAFGEHITSGDYKRSSSSYEEGKRTKIREFLLIPIGIIAVAILLVRLFSIQIVSGSYYRSLSDSNRIRTITIHAPRGIIFDRNGIPLVYNIPGFRQKVGDKTRLLTNDEALSLIAKGEKGIEVDSLRQYPYKDQLAVTLGYIGQISENQLKDPNYSNYKSGDLLGKSGIEESFESFLVGLDGKKLLEVDSSGKERRVLGQTDATAGQDVITTLDVKLQTASYNAMPVGKKGAVVVSTPKGEILTLVSLPSFDPNLFTLGESYKASSSSYQTLSEIISDGTNFPLLNRAISGTYPPGSTFKLVTAAAGLQNNKIDENYEVNDTGVITLGAFSFANWYFTQYGKTEGNVNVVDAIKRSNDIFFYKLGELVGVEKLSQEAEKFGLGKKLGIELSGEETGLVPTDAWKRKVIGEGWYLGDTYHYGIGQGYLLTTPLQVNGLTQAIANGGVLYEPHLLKSQKSKVKSQNLLNRKSLELIRQGMTESCSIGGVAWPIFDFKVKNPKLKIDGKNFTEVPQATVSADFSDYRHVSVACKTGTAQHGGEDTPPHAWITLFAPAYDPQIVITVLVESSGEGSNVAAPVAKKILDEWFSR